MTEETPTRTTATPTKSEEQNQTMKREAMLPNLSWRLLVFGNTSEESEEALEVKLLPAYHSIIKQFLTSGVEAGAFIAEAGDFAAYAAWFPPGSHEEPKRSSEASELEGKISIEGLGLEHDKVRDELIWSKHGQEYWYLGLLGRDPRKPAVSGAVRAVLQPSMDRAAVEGKPVWLTTSSPHARDIYLHLGWERVRTVEFGGFESWCMILYPPGTEEGPR